MQCTSPIRLKKNLNPSEYPDGLLVPCGKCLACRIAKRREWSMRVFHELDSFNNVGVFLTLTYNNESMPIGKEGYPTLVKRDLQLFIKRLRKIIYPTKIKYFACGEYGDQFERPHYHLIILGLTYERSNNQYWLKVPEDGFKFKIPWDSGFSYYGNAEPDSIRYVCQYIDKKFSGDLANVEYDLKGREPVFRLVSNGMGKDFVLKNNIQLIENEEITVFGIKQTFPRYYMSKLEIDNKDWRRGVSMQRDIDFVFKYTGEKMTSDEYYLTKSPDEVKRLEDIKKSQYKQKDKNLNIRLANKRLQKKSYEL